MPGHRQHDKLALAGLKDDRRAVVGGGLCILYTLLTQFGIQELLQAKGALRQGVIFDLVERLQSSAGFGAAITDMREASVQALQRRFGVDVAHARRVRELSLRLHGQLAGGRTPRELQRELGWAADLHEMGMMVSHHDYHRHSAYLLAHVDAAGFSQNQLQHLGDLVLGQRGGLRKLERQLGDEGFLWQVLALRLAAICNHARTELDARALKLRRQGRALTLSLPKDWATSQPRAVFLLQEEAQAWARNGGLTLTVD